MVQMSSQITEKLKKLKEAGPCNKKLYLFAWEGDNVLRHAIDPSYERQSHVKSEQYKFKMLLLR